MQGDAGIVKVALIEDDEDDYLITRDMLRQQNRTRFTVDWCSDYEGALAVIRDERHDVYLIDYRLGAHTGLDLVRAGFTARPGAPVIILTSQTDYEIDLEATNLGVTDFLLKQELNPLSLERSIRYAISHHRAIRELAQSQERYALAARAVNDGIWDWDLESNSVYFSPRWRALLGQPEAAAHQSPDAWFELVHPDDLPRLQEAIAAHLTGQTPHMQSEHRMRHADGSWRWVLTRGLAIRETTGGRPTRMAGSLSDITERRRAEHQLRHDAFHDSLTGLPNRALFMDRLEHALVANARDPTAVHAVLFLDIDRFKLVNDSLSHAIGDRLLVLSAARVADALRPGDTVARIGGDEFTILLEDVGAESPGQFATAVATRIQESLNEVFKIDDHRLFITASIGISLSTPDISAEDLLRNADIAMYEAKRGGRGRCATFDQSMHHYVTNRLRRENDLRRGVERSLFRVHYQPIVDLRTGRLRGFEALVRWPEGWAPVEPEEFIPIAEETGLIGPLGLQVLQIALADLAAWRRAGLLDDDVRMSVNVSGRQLDDPNFPQDVLGAIEAAGLPCDVVGLEITESTFMREPERIADIVSEVCAPGVGLEMDDFGTGYSSLAALHKFPVNALKIDQSFVAALHLGGDSEVIVRSILALANSLGLQVIAEGIERPDQLHRLRKLGCDFGQGYSISEPVSADEVESFLRVWSPEQVVGAQEPIGLVPT
jgi:diguanylate cyclase (GGDEF)-like protein/PAS domain S-box-containing protein